MFMTLCVSYVYELMGRKLTIFFSYFTTAIVMFSIPYTAPSYNYLLVARCAMGFTMAAPIQHPLIPDYIKRSSRGQAVAMTGIGFVFGELFSMGILLNFTKSMSFKESFAITSVLILIFSLYFLITIKEPDFKQIRNNINANYSQNAVIDTHRSPKSSTLTFEDLSLFQKIKSLTLITVNELKKNPLLMICMVGATITKLLSVLFSTYLILWIQSF